MTADGQKWTGETIFPSTKNYIDPDSHDIKEVIPKITPKKYYKRWNFFGMYWVGIPPFKGIYKYEMEWKDYENTDNGYKITPRKEETPYLFAKRVSYAVTLKAAETSEQYPVDIDFVFFAEAKNAYKPIFASYKAFQQIQEYIIATATTFIKASTFASLNLEKSLKDHEVEREGFSKAISSLTDKINGEASGILEKYGYVIEGAQILSITIVGEAAAKISEATMKVAIAEQNKQAKIKEAEGEAGAMDAITASKEKRYQLFKNNPEAVAIEIAEKTFGNSNLTTYVNNGTVIPTVPTTPA